MTRFNGGTPVGENRVEVGYFPRDDLYDFPVHRGDVIRISPGEPLHCTMSLPHWITDLCSVQEHGVELVGAPKDRFIPPIDAEQFKSAVREMITRWLDWVGDSDTASYQAYVRLAMCRSLYAVTTGEQASKVRAAHWFAEQYPQWRLEVVEALHWRRHHSQTMNPGGRRRTEAMVRFAYHATRN